MTHFYIDFNPDVSEFNQLISLLDTHGFYDNITQPHDRIKICKSFDNGGFVAMYADKEPIGFTVWDGEMQSAIIDYKWLHPDYRNRGLGRLFARLVYQEFLKRNIIYILSEPATPCGFGIANSFGFKALKDTDYRFDTRLYYMFLKSNRQQIKLSNSGYELLIWHDWNNQKDAAQIYRIDDTMKTNPIISIVDTDAYVELRRDGIPIKGNVCKRFFSDDESQLYGLLYFNTNLSDWLIKLDIK